MMRRQTPLISKSSDGKDASSREQVALPCAEVLFSPMIYRKDYERPLRVATSNITAATNTAPLTIYCDEISMPIRFMPLVRESITSAPMIEPVTLPTPPAADTPPT